PEPDLPPLVVNEARVAEVRETMPELPDARRRRFVAAYALPEYDAGGLTQSAALADYFEQVAKASGNAKATSNWVMGELLRTLKERALTIEQLALTPSSLAALIALVDKGTISSTTAKDVFSKMYDSGRSADEIVTAEGLAQNSDEEALLAIVRDVITKHQDA